VLTLGIWVVVIIGAITGYFAYDLPNTDKALEVSRRPLITFTARDGSKISESGNLKGVAVRMKNLPKYIPQAVIATEDRRFYKHHGVDIMGIIRAFARNIEAGRIVQGGSTISQQAAKNLFLTPDRTFKRKYQELLLAIWLEQKFTKDQILSIYLNRVYLGSGTYGIDAASRKYFGVPAYKMSVFEAAIIAGLLKAPSKINPKVNLKAAILRGKVVISNMVAAGYLTEKQAINILKQKIYYQGNYYRQDVGGYFVDWISKQLRGYIGPQTRDIIVKTTLDLKLQSRIETFINSYFKKYSKKYNVQQCAIVIMSPKGEILAMVGGKNYQKSQFNRSTQAYRQPGSAFKPIVYLAAIEAGLKPNSKFIDSPVKIGGWSPQNYDRKFHGEMTLKQSLARSINTIAVKLSERIGRDAVIKTSKRLGITAPLKASPSLALGTFGVSLIELTGAYAVLANGGMGIWPFGLREIKYHSGDKLYIRHGGGTGQIIQPEHVKLMNTMMREVILSGTGKNAKLDTPAYGKTGTSQAFRDGWFIGYTKDIVAGVWIGNDNESSMKKVTGGTMPAVIWKKVMNEAQQINLGKDKTIVDRLNPEPFWKTFIRRIIP
jgi:penicillin-binding protein 1A